ncbi:unnamed protein product [Aphanomyces euteiches]|uniref:Adenylate kinase n=1 Tax=Aphanomyces euteiches TaxID=100861 RepID=A0A6G0WGG0_9STRA|nr:hypothetical protein Ae201684_015583 [Aphanomyces euteiches]KAH9084199.1 hypothetical protein Ae201684P_020451 [Aphanomyces euteiches]KAH9136051.1 hypothetical protein AeRB84_018678 [Aphanomyces euteiches]
MPLNPCRIVVIGITSSGKSTLASKLSLQLGIPFIDTDALFWAPNWQKAADFAAKMTRAIETPTWALAGHFTTMKDVIYTRAQVVVWLDYSLWTVFWQLLRRCFYRWWTQELLWGTNRESMWTHLKVWSNESLIHWLFKNYARIRREYPNALAKHPHLQIFRFRHPRETQAWLDSIA